MGCGSSVTVAETVKEETPPPVVLVVENEEDEEEPPDDTQSEEETGSDFLEMIVEDAKETVRHTAISIHLSSL